MKAADLAKVRTRLQRRRREILEAARRALAAIDQLRGAERDPEPAGASQSEQIQYDLSRLGEVEQLEIGRIDAAIARLDAGEYGTCRDCHQKIDRRRLVALPFVLECADCASRREKADGIERELAKRPRTMVPE